MRMKRVGMSFGLKESEVESQESEERGSAVSLRPLTTGPGTGVLLQNVFSLIFMALLG
jgi:hypothetical protein